jgi:emopamil binding protein
MPSAHRPPSRKDGAIITLLAFFSLFNVTLDLWFVLHAGHLSALVGQRRLADLWAFYAEADRFWIVGNWSLAQESLNVFVTTLVNLWLIRAIRSGAPSRHAVQLALGAYVSYSIVLYFLAAHVDGYPGMRERTVLNFLLFYGTTLPWLLGHAYLAWDSFVAITARFALAPRRS